MVLYICSVVEDARSEAGRESSAKGFRFVFMKIPMKVALRSPTRSVIVTSAPDPEILV